MNRFRNVTLVLVLFLVTLGALFGVRQMEYSLDRTINEERLRFTGTVSDAPPAVVFTTMALGSFRGLLADMLWLRSESLKSKKNYFEMVQLARWITDLQPNYSGGTVYLAWNLAYNISVTSSDWEDRWYWVNEGIKLIRDKALVYNPDDPMLYRELSWIYLHKLGNLMDDAHLYYKNQMATQMNNVLGRFRTNIKPLADAPVGKEGFMQVYPEDHPLWAAVRESGYKDYDDLAARFRIPVQAALPEDLKIKQEYIDALDAHFRAELLRERFKLDPRRMQAIDEKYGRMDWRVPESQAIYWAELGVEKSSADGRQPDINCTRIVTHALQAAFRSGRVLMIDEDSRVFQAVPNLNLADSAYAAFEAAEHEFVATGAGESFRSAKINYLKDAIPLIYIYGNRTKAQEFYEKLVTIDGQQRQSTMEEFVRQNFVEDVRDADVEKATSVISMLIQRALWELLLGNRDVAVYNESLARTIHQIYTQRNRDVRRNQLPEFDQIKYYVVANMVRNLPEAAGRRLIEEIRSQQAESAVGQPGAATGM